MAEEKTSNVESPAQLLAGELDQKTTPAAKPVEKPAEKPGEQVAAKPGETNPDALAKLINDAVEARLKPLQDRVDKYEKSGDALDEKRKANDAREDFIRAQPNIPASMLRRYLPETGDKAALYAAAGELSKDIKAYLDFAVSKGAIKYIDVGGANREGGTPVTSLVASTSTSSAKQSPQQMLADDLDGKK